MQTWGNLEEPPKLQRISSTLYKFDNPNTLSTVPHDTYLTLQRTPSLVDMVNRQSDVTGFILDVRGTYRATFGGDMFQGVALNTDRSNAMQTWSAAGRVGFEF